MLRYFSILLSASAAIAQSSLSGPSLGFVFDPNTQSIRPIWGIPGAATAGKPVDFGVTFTTAAVSPTNDFAIAISAADGSVNVALLNPSGPALQPIVDAPNGPDRIAVSPAGKSAVLYYPANGAAVVLKGLPETPQISRRIDLSLLPRAPHVIAINDEATLLLAAVSENGAAESARGEIFLFDENGTGPRPIAQVQHASAIVFLAQSHDVLLADDAANSVLLLQDVSVTAAVAWNFIDDRLPAPDSVQASPDHQSFFAASSKNGVAAILDASGSNPVFVVCGCKPSGLRPLGTAAIYQVTEPANGIMWLLDGDLSYPRLLFVPVPSDPANTSSPASDKAGTAGL